MRPTTKLRNLLNGGSLVVAPFILNALHAKIAQSVGFQAVYMTGSGTAAERDFPDVGLLTMTAMVKPWARAMLTSPASACAADAMAPTPTKIKAKVPMNSATQAFIFMTFSPCLDSNPDRAGGAGFAHGPNRNAPEHSEGFPFFRIAKVH